MNTIEVKGNVARSQLRYTQSGKPMLTFSLADNSGKGENKKTQWFDCIIFGDAAEEFQHRIAKGVAVHCFGRLALEQYQKRDGTQGFSAKIWTDKVLVGEEVQWGRGGNNQGFTEDNIPY
jgi:single-strand DNA-binding protein